jgi:hypothetical protein
MLQAIDAKLAQVLLELAELNATASDGLGELTLLASDIVVVKGGFEAFLALYNRDFGDRT